VPGRGAGAGRCRLAEGVALNAPLAHVAVNAAPELGIRNSQPEGIGRVVALDDLVCWNNLGRNVVFADTRLRPLAVFGTTLFPGQDDPSQYDLDVHAILDVPELGSIVFLNHFGTLRGFRRDDVLGRSTGLLEQPAGRLVEPACTWAFVADVERTVAVNGRLVGSVPRSEGAEGLLVSARLGVNPDGDTIPVKPFATAFGEVTALGATGSPGGPLIGVGGVGQVALFSLLDGRVGRARWEVAVGFRVANVAWSDDLLWAAGPDLAGAVDDYDWESLTGGGFVALDPADGAIVMSGGLPGDVAWGTGGVAVAPFGHWVAAVGRSGRVHLIDPARREAECSTEPLSSRSLGIAHMAVSSGRVVCGFNRGGYRLHAFSQPAPAEDGR
jgi:hypothetical protein